jgi:hypothetical protein
MVKGLSVILLLVVCVVALIPIHSVAWSVEGHQVITKYAIEWLPSPWRQFFNYYGWFLIDAAAYPDTYYREIDPSEGPRHYVDLEVWNPSDPSTGTLPQAVEEFTYKMQSAIEATDWNGAFLFAGQVAHYIQDAAQPYHTTINYNPLNKAGVGLHAVLDASLMAHLSEMQLQTPSNLEAITPIENLTKFTWNVAIQSHSFLPVINQTLINEGLDWSPELTRIIENRTNTAITAAAKVWYTAIVGAKSRAPNIPANNQLSIIVENVTLADNGAAMIRLRVIDSLRVGTYANVTLTAGSSTFRGQVANVVPPVGEYVVLSETGLHPNGSLTAQRGGYITATLVVSSAASNLTSLGHLNNPQTTLATRAGTGVPNVTIVAVVVMLAGILALVILRRAPTDS